MSHDRKAPKTTYEILSSLRPAWPPHTLNPRVRVQTLMRRQLEHRTPSVPRNRAHEEIRPTPVPPLSVRFDLFVFVGDPAIVPLEESSGVMEPGMYVGGLDSEPGVST